MTYIISITLFFILAGVALPFIDAEFNQSRVELPTSTLDTTTRTTNYGNPDESSGIFDKLVGVGSTTVTAVSIIFSIISMLVWNPFAGLWINIILFMPLRLWLGILIYRQLRSGGG